MHGPLSVSAVLIMLSELFNDGAQPYNGMSNLAVMTMVQCKGHGTCPASCPAGFWEHILKPCWAFDPKARPTFSNQI